MNEKPRFVRCKSCGSPEFRRLMTEADTIVRLIENKRGFVDDVIREGETEFRYECTQCETVLDDANE